MTYAQTRTLNPAIRDLDMYIASRIFLLMWSCFCLGFCVGVEIAQRLRP